MSDIITLEEITDKILDAELCENCKKMLKSLALELREAILVEMKSDSFEKQGLMTDVLFQQLDGPTTRAIYEIVVAIEHGARIEAKTG